MTSAVLVAALTRRAMAFAQPFAQAYAVGAMNSSVRILRGAVHTFDPATRKVVTTADTVVYADDVNHAMPAPAGITPARGPVTMELGDEPEYFSSATIYIPAAGAFIRPMVDDVVMVWAGPDPDLTNRMFRVTDVVDGGRITSCQELSCVGIQPSSQWA